MNERSPFGSTGSAQAERSGPEKMSSIPVRRTRWVGLSRASMLTSIPKMVCHSQSPTPPIPKTITPTTAPITASRFPPGPAGGALPCYQRGDPEGSGGERNRRGHATE